MPVIDRSDVWDMWPHSNTPSNTAPPDERRCWTCNKIKSTADISACLVKNCAANRDLIRDAEADESRRGRSR